MFFDELMATNKESAPGPDGIPYSLYRCAGGLGFTLLFIVYQHTLAGGLVPLQFCCLQDCLHSQVLRRR